MAAYPRPLLLFDGTCALCDGTVRWLLRRDRRGQIHFAPLQSNLGRAALGEHGLGEDLVSIVLIDGQGAHQFSDAALRIARLLPYPWRLGVVLRIVPRPLRDAAYRLIARNRYRWFGRRDACILPAALPPDQQARLLV